MRLHAIVAGLVIFVLSPMAFALSLGEATAQSHLNQPLKATIPVTSVRFDERDTIRVVVPGPEKFQRAGVRRDAIVENMRIEVVDGIGDDELLIKLSTSKRIQEPFVNFLIEVRSVGGSVIREYTILLDPAPVAEARRNGGSEDVSTSPLIEPRQAGLQPAIGENQAYVPEQETSSDLGQYAFQPQPAGSRQYGPVRAQETLWSIAMAMRTDSSLTMDQMQLAIYQANPQAFEGNINRMLKGVMLTVPSNSEIRAIDPDFARREVARQRGITPAPAPAPVSRQTSPGSTVAVAAREPEKPAPTVNKPVEKTAEPVAEQQEARQVAEPVDVEEAETPEEAFMGASEGEDEAVEETPSDESSASDAGDTDSSAKSQDAAAAFAESTGLTDEEMEADTDAADENLDMPSVWSEDEESSEDPLTDAGEDDEIVDVAPEESRSLSIPEVGNPVVLGLALAILVLLLGAYVWFRRNRATNVGDQFAYASESDLEDNDEPEVDESDSGSTKSAGKTGAVWGDDDDVPDAIDQYAGSTAGAEDLELPEAPAPKKATASDSTSEAEILGSEDSSPIRDISSEDVDYLGDADVHLAYGLYDEAASVLLTGIEENPERSDLRLKLLEVYHAGAMSEEFVSAAEDWKKVGISNEEDWKKAEKLGHEIAPHSALFAGGSPAQTEELEVDDVLADEPEETLEELEDVLQAEEPKEEVKAEAESEETIEDEGDDGLDFDLSGFDMSGPAEEADAGSADQETDESEDASAGEESDEDDGDLEFNIDDISFDDVAETKAGDEVKLPSLDDDEPADATPEQTDADKGLEGLGVSTEDADPLALDADALDTAADVPEKHDQASDAVGDSGDDQEEVSVKLDLARAYIDMGEPEMAKALLDEVMTMGSEQQRQEAQELIDRTG